MRRSLCLLCFAACSVPDKHPSTTDAVDETWIPGDAIETRITDAPTEFSNAAVATFQFTSNFPNAQFECRVDGEPASACVSPFSRSLPDGSHTFSVRATDGNGAGDDTPAEHLWTIDTVAPNTTLTEAPPAADNSTIVHFAFEASEKNVTFDCALDGAEYSACESGGDVGPVGDGAHSFAVRAHDRAGNVDASPAIYAWSVDTSTPDTQILGGPTGSSGETAASFTFVSPDAGGGATFECALDGA